MIVRHIGLFLLVVGGVAGNAVLASCGTEAALLADAGAPVVDTGSDGGARPPAGGPAEDGASSAPGDASGADAGTLAKRRVYGTSVQGQPLEAFEVTPTAPNGKKALLTFALHGFEDAFAQDGRALYAIAEDVIAYYGTAPERLHGWSLHVVPTANPDGMRNGTNNLRESAAAFGRCTSLGKDVNRNVSEGTSAEQRALKALFDEVKPTIAVDFHGWYDTYYGNAKLGDYFARAFNASYPAKPRSYCFVDATGAMDCGEARGGIFHASTKITTDLFAEWASRVRDVPSVLVEYPAPDLDLDGAFDTVLDPTLGRPVLRPSTHAVFWDRTRVALDDLFATY